MIQCGKDCHAKFNPERDPEKCAGKNVLEKGTCDDCIKECTFTALGVGADPVMRCSTDCVFKLNPEHDPEKCTGKNFHEKGTCDHCMKECKVAHGGASASRNFSVTVVVISFFVALMW